MQFGDMFAIFFLSFVVKNGFGLAVNHGLINNSFLGIVNIITT